MWVRRVPLLLINDLTVLRSYRLIPSPYIRYTMTQHILGPIRIIQCAGPKQGIANQSLVRAGPKKHIIYQPGTDTIYVTQRH